MYSSLDYTSFTKIKMKNEQQRTNQNITRKDNRYVFTYVIILELSQRVIVWLKIVEAFLENL